MPDTNIYVVYKTTNKINNRFYIGVHKLNNKRYLGSGKLIKQAIKKYGPENFTFEVIKSFDNDTDAYEFERMVITDDLIKSRQCYNITEGGGKPPIMRGNDNWMHHTGFAHENHPMKGRTHTDETKLKIGLKHKGKVITDEQRVLLSKAGKGKRLGKENPSSKRCLIKGIEFDTQVEASRYFGVHKHTIRRWIKEGKDPLCRSLS